MPAPSQQLGDDQFSKAAAEKQAGLLREFWLFLKANKKWWLTPVILILLAVTILIILGSSAAAPYIYTLF